MTSSSVVERRALLDRDHAVAADLLHRLGDQVADRGVLGRDGRDVRRSSLGLVDRDRLASSARRRRP